MYSARWILRASYSILNCNHRCLIDKTKLRLIHWHSKSSIRSGSKRRSLKRMPTNLKNSSTLKKALPCLNNWGWRIYTELVMGTNCIKLLKSGKWLTMWGNHNRSENYSPSDPNRSSSENNQSSPWKSYRDRDQFWNRLNSRKTQLKAKEKRKLFWNWIKRVWSRSLQFQSRQKSHFQRRRHRSLRPPEGSIKVISWTISWASMQASGRYLPWKIWTSAMLSTWRSDQDSIFEILTTTSPSQRSQALPWLQTNQWPI